jgi:hypothetical protein
VAFDTALADRIRARLGKRKGLTEKKMFGGIAFMLADLGKWAGVGAKYAESLPPK